MNSIKVFISYSRADSKLALKLAKNLDEQGVEVWIDQSQIPAGKRWDQSIEEALIKSDVVLVILSPSSVKSQIVMDEVNFALEEEKQLVPIRYKLCRIPFRLKRIQWIDFLSGYELGYKKLLKTLNIQEELKANEKAKTSDETTNQVLNKAPLKFPRIFPESSDEPAFLLILDKVITTTISKNSPENVYIIRIDNWFDHKWLKFSGIGKIITNNTPASETKLAEFHIDQITVPPFNPNRVVSQHFFQRDSKGLYFQRFLEKPIHRNEKMPSARNIQRRIADIAKSALFFWFSSNSAKNQKGAIMVYIINEKILTWYSLFGTTINSSSWKVERIKGITKNEVESFISG